MMIGIHQAATVNPAAQEVNAEVSGKLVLLDGALSVGHAVHRGGDPATVDIDDDRPPLPAPSAVNLAERRCVFGSQGLGVGVVRPVVPPYPKTLTCEHIRDGRDLELV